MTADELMELTEEQLEALLVGQIEVGEADIEASQAIIGDPALAAEIEADPGRRRECFAAMDRRRRRMIDRDRANREVFRRRGEDYDDFLRARGIDPVEWRERIERGY